MILLPYSVSYTVYLFLFNYMPYCFKYPNINPVSSSTSFNSLAPSFHNHISFLGFRNITLPDIRHSLSYFTIIPTSLNSLLSPQSPILEYPFAAKLNYHNFLRKVPCTLTTHFFPCFISITNLKFKPQVINTSQYV